MNSVSPGKDTTEWTAFKWVALICGALASGLGVIIASGAVVDPTVQAILGGAAAVLGAIAGMTGQSYIKGRTAVKSAASIASHGGDGANPTD